MAKDTGQSEERETRADEAPPRDDALLIEACTLAARLAPGTSAFITLGQSEAPCSGRRCPAMRDDDADCGACPLRVLAATGPVVVNDALRDARTRDLEPIRSGRVGFYVGQPLRVGDDLAGTLCVVTGRPRPAEPATAERLRSVAALAEHHLTMRRASLRAGAPSVLLQLLNASHDGVLLLDARSDFDPKLDFEIVWANDRAAQIMGFPGDPSGVRLRSSPLDDCTSRLLAHVERAFESQIAESFDYECTRSGALRWMRVVARRIDHTHVAVVLNDVTESRETQRALEVEEERFKAVVEGSPNGVVIVDADGRIEFVNLAVERLTGYRREELIDQNFEILVPPSLRSVIRPGLASAKSDTTRLSQAREAAVLHKDGTEAAAYVALSEFRLGATRCFTVTLQDLSELKEMEEAQRAHLQFMETLLNTMPSPIFYKGVDGRYLGCNRAFAEAVGLTEEELIGKTVQEIVPERFADQYCEMDNSLFACPGRQAYQTQVEFCDGQAHDVLMHKATYHDSSGHVAGIVGILTDITERTKFEQRIAARLRYEGGVAACSRALLSSGEERDVVTRALRELLAAAEADCGGMYDVLREDGEFVALRQTYCVHAAEARGVATAAQSLEQLDLNGVLHRWREQLLSGRPVAGPIEAFPETERQSLTLIGVKSLVVLPLVFDEQCRGVIAFSDLHHSRTWGKEDIRMLQTAAEMIGSYVERRRAEDILRDSEERYRLLAENATDMISHHTPDGAFRYVSPACRKILGYRFDELADISLFTLIHEDDVERVRERQRVLIQDAADYTVAYRAYRKDGSVIWVESSARALYDPDQGAVSHVVMVSRDVTERRRVEEELRARTTAQRMLNLELEAQKQQLEAQRQELEAINTALEKARNEAEAANRSKSEFLANMSHEIRTPMTAILGYADLIREGGFDDREHRRHLETIRRNGEHLLTIINDILDLSKIEAGKFQTDRAHCDLTQVIADVLSMMHVRAKEKGLDLSVEYDVNVPAEITTDPIRLRQILVNLVGNAIKFTDHGSVRLHVALAPRPTGQMLISIAVADTGIGMTKEQQDGLFRPFSQVDTSATRRFGGTGLGLTISKRLTEMLGGDIEVDSRPGVGSCFIVTIDPAPYNAVGPLAYQSSSVVRPGGLSSLPDRLAGRVLLAEDGLDNQRLISLLLKKAGLCVEIAQNGREACEMAIQAHGEQRPYDIILMDMQMPEMDGYAATRHLRCEGYTLPVIALTAHAMTGDREKCLEAGCDDFATKPIQRSELLTCCSLWISEARIRRATESVN